jgi:hypothetical protein
VSKNNKGMICILAEWEIENHENGIAINCADHRHISRRRAFERTSHSLFADRVLKNIYTAQFDYVGSVVEVAGQARWATRRQDQDLSKPAAVVSNECWQFIVGYMNRVQAMIDARQEPPEYIYLSPRYNNPRITRDAAMVEAIRSYSPSALTARVAELVAGATWGKRKPSKK